MENSNSEMTAHIIQTNARCNTCPYLFRVQWNCSRPWVTK